MGSNVILTQTPQPRPQAVVMPTCNLRGDKIGERDCPACGNRKVRLTVYACPYYADGVTYQDCRTHRLSAQAQCLPPVAASTTQGKE